MNTYIGIDLGTSGVKVLLTTAEGEILASAVKNYPTMSLKDGCSEQDPYMWESAVYETLGAVLKGQDTKAVKAIGVAGQMHGLVALDRKNNVIRPCILWNDSRSQNECDYINEEFGEDKLSLMTGNVAFAGFTAPKALYMYYHEGRKYDKIRKVMLPKDFINFCLTGEIWTDYSDAGGTLFLDVRKRRWRKEVCEYALPGKGMSVLPPIFESYEPVATLKGEIAEKFDLCKDTIVCGGAADNAAAALGMGAVNEGDLNISIGTSGTIYAALDSFKKDRGHTVHSFPSATGGYSLLACTLSAASAYDWWVKDILRDGSLSQDDLWPHLGKNKLIFLPYLKGERCPHDDVNAKGVFFGMTSKTTREDMILAVMEGVAYNLRFCLFNLTDPIGCKSLSDRTTICGGGAKSEIWKNIISSCLDRDIMTTKVEEGPAYGAAILSMTSAGEYKDAKEAAGHIVKSDKTYSPDKELASHYKEMLYRANRLYFTLEDTFEEFKK